MFADVYIAFPSQKIRERRVMRSSKTYKTWHLSEYSTKQWSL